MPPTLTLIGREVWGAAERRAALVTVHAVTPRTRVVVQCSLLLYLTRLNQPPQEWDAN
jgi:hypothetical protein